MELASPQVHKSGNSLHVSHGDDKGLFVTFYNESVESPFKSEQAGHPVFDEVPFIHIIFPGNTTTQIRKPAKLKSDNGVPSDPERFPKQWAAFQSQTETVTEGMPLTEWAPITKSVALNLKAIHVHTVEQLASLPDTALTWLGARDLQMKAKTWLKNAGDSAEVMRLAKENDNLKTDIEALKKQMAEIADLQKSHKGNKHV
jgi:hypothetical protein